MKKVVLLGDSIRQIGYGARVAELLKDEFTVWQPTDNCRFAQYTLRGLFDWQADIEGSDIIHWNNGHWDLCELFGDGTFTPVERYVELMVRIAKLLKQQAKTVIFATTTPVLPQNPYNRNEVIAQFNAAVVPELEKLGVVINDLNTLLAADIPACIREDDMIHLTDAGIELAAAQVVACIRTEAEKLG